MDTVNQVQGGPVDDFCWEFLDVDERSFSTLIFEFNMCKNNLIIYTYTIIYIYIHVHAMCMYIYISPKCLSIDI